MNLLRAIIIDDEPKGLSSLRLLIEKYITGVKVVEECTDPLRSIDLINNYKPEIVFLDINMPHLNGFELLERLTYRDFYLIFITAYQEYALKAIKNNAVDYLLKPVDADDLEATIERVKKLHAEKNKFPDFTAVLSQISQRDKIPFNVKDKVEYVSREDIVRMESESNYTHVYLADGNKILIAKTIGDYEQMLCTPDSEFMRVHQSHIINLNKVSRYLRDNGGTIVLKNNDHVPLSKNKKEDFMKWLAL